MLARQRHDTIVDAVTREGSVRVRELAEELNVSEMTVRRDLEQLEQRGLVERTHGGAVYTGADVPAPSTSISSNPHGSFS